MVRSLVRGALLLLLGAALLVIAIWLLMAASLPKLDGGLSLHGLSAEVTVERDALGVVTIDARNREDAMRALGHVHAQERYFEMDLMRRTAAGELAALFGPAAVEADKRHRIHRMRARVREHMDTITGTQRAMIEAYVEGVNAGLADLKARPWPYLLLRKTPEPWRLEDSALVAYAMYFDLQDASNADELALWKLKPHLPAPLFELITHGGSRWDAPITGAAVGDATLPGPDRVDLRQLPFDDTTAIVPLPDARVVGSNNFAVAGSLTRNGRAIVADDMHLGLRAPNIWFRARLRYPERNAAGGRVDATGFTLPGLPAIVVGSNGHVAWAFTNSYGDWLDWRQLPPCPHAAADCMPGTTVVERIEVAGADDVDFEIEETAWGPVLHRDDKGNRLALRWVAHLPGSLTMELARFAETGTVNAALRLADDIAIPAQNLLVGDAHGRIAWRLLGPLPDRGEHCIASPRDTAGRSADTLLGDLEACPPWALAASTGVSVSGPGTARLWTANSRVVDGDMLARIGDGGYSLGARGQQIRDSLEARRRFDEHDLLRIQLDDRALFLQRWHDLLQQQAQQARTPALQTVAAAAAGRSGHAGIDSVGYRLVRGWRLKVLERITDGLLSPARDALGEDFAMPALKQLEGVAWPLVTEQPMHLLSPRHDTWQALFEDAAAELRDELEASGPLEERNWGERNTARICHPLSRALPDLAKPLLCMPAEPLPGDSHMPRVQGPDFGASQRMVVSPGHEADGIAHMPGGQSGHPLSPFWGAGHDDWVHGRPTPFLPEPARYTLVLTPAK
ncbi:penicillin acylase family protein [Marilutibacter alkalisoli]|uniref:Penicillin acylase family protein n=1 Tax=Marilutibacter alkalisoli TaxID=2591633 RepID=A0A514BTI4_9GAMM|nr:penicillin acylase family protein [Lysobacter alkalisoli]QDH70615.1 penicillin acylase family protein [Lysobacter alkalisoli]